MLAEERFFQSTYQKRRYRCYVPSGYRHGRRAPLLVMLHGCHQSAEDFAVATRMNEYAEQHTLLVVYPEQLRRANPRRCWNWFLSKNQMRGRGEPADIVGMVEQIRSNYSIDSERIYVAGMSAGGAMAAILAATYPDLFAAVGICAGVAYRAATSTTDAFKVMRHGRVNMRESSSAAYLAMGEHRRALPVVVFQGSADTVVAPVNATHLCHQWVRTNRLAARSHHIAPDAPIPVEIITHTPAGRRAYTEYLYDDHDSVVSVRLYLVEGMGHAWPGGAAHVAFTDPYGPDANQLLLDFFFRFPMSGPLPLITLPPPVRVAPVPATAQAVPSRLPEHDQRPG